MAHLTLMQQIYWQYILEPFHDDLPDDLEQWQRGALQELGLGNAQFQHWVVISIQTLQQNAKTNKQNLDIINNMKQWLHNDRTLTTPKRLDRLDKQLERLADLQNAYQTYAKDMMQAYQLYKEVIVPALPTRQVSKFLVALQMRIDEHQLEMIEPPIDQQAIEDEMTVIRGQYPPKKIEGPVREYLEDKAWDLARKNIGNWPLGVPTSAPFENIPGGHWTSVKELGKGGMGVVTLEVLYDQNGRVRNRMAKKITENVGHANALLDPDTWKQLPNDRLVPLEWVVQTFMNPYRFSVKTLGIPSVGQKPDARLTHQMYMSYAARGDLSNVIDQHSALDIAVPETFVWLVFKALVEMAVVMKNGGMHPVAGWEVFHRDLKPENIFLDLADPAHVAQFPRPVVADWGLSILTQESDPANPRAWTYCGTPGHKAPEQFSYIDEHTVFGIGTVMLALMHLRDLDEPDQNFGDGREDSEVETYDVESIFWPRFSNELRGLVIECLRRAPEDRPSPEDLLRRIKAHQNSNDKPRNARNGLVPAILEELVTREEDETYKIGFCRVPEPLGPLLGSGLRIMNPDLVDSDPQ